MVHKFGLLLFLCLILYRDPNLSGGGTDQPSNQSRPIWPEYGDSGKYLQVQLNEEEVRSDYRGEEVYFWNEYLPELNEAAQELCPRRTLKAPVDDCDTKLIVGEKLGFSLTPEQAESLILTMIFICVALLCLIVLVGAVSVGYKVKSKAVGQVSEVKVERGAAKKHHYEPTIESHPQTTTYENVSVPLVHSIEINHKAEQLSDSEEEAASLPEKHPVPDSDNDEIPPHYASVDKSRHPTEEGPGTPDEEVKFPPPPDDWSTKSTEDQGEQLDPKVDPQYEDVGFASVDAEEPGEEDAERDQDPSKVTGGEGTSDVSEPDDDENTQSM